jgi:hypothetical protein
MHMSVDTIFGDTIFFYGKVSFGAGRENRVTANPCHDFLTRFSTGCSLAPEK